MSRRIFALLSCLLLSASGCTPSIGDHCVLSTDCSLQGNRLCDTSQPNGYCTIFNCSTNSCPDNTACVLFDPQIAGCTYNDRVPSRTGQSFCMKPCHSDSDCRQADGYVCADPKQPPWNAFILDDDQTKRICVLPPTIPPSFTPNVDASAPVCSTANPNPVSPIDASQPDAPVDAKLDAPSDAPSEASVDAGTDAAVDAGSDAADAGTSDAGDAGPTDATAGG